MVNKVTCLIVFFISCNMCLAQNAQLQSTNGDRKCIVISCSLSLIDSCMVKNLGKENTDILLKADSVVATTIAWQGCKEQILKLPEYMVSIVKYTYCTPAMYVTNKKVYASFQPYLILTFYCGKQTLSIQFDYGINKWMIKTCQESIICHDLKNTALLPLFYILFKNNPLIEESYKKLLQ